MIKNKYSRRSFHFVLGFISGLPLMLFTQTLRVWLVSLNYDVVDLGWPSLMTIPLVFKFCWAPMVDRFAMKSKMGMKQCMIWMQGLVAVALLLMVLTHRIEGGLQSFIMATFLLACGAATFDTALDAYRIQVLAPEEQSWCMSLASMGYRCAMMVSGGLVIWASTSIAWSQLYCCMSGLSFLSLLFLLFIPQASGFGRKSEDVSILKVIKERLSQQSLWMLFFLLTFKAGIYWLDDWLNVFLGSHGIGFTTQYIGITQMVGIWFAVLGVFTVPLIIKRVSLSRLLYWVLTMEVLLFFLFSVIALVFSYVNIPHDDHLFSVGVTASICYEHFVFGFAGSVLVICLMRLVCKEIPATEYACYSALTLVPKTLSVAVGWIIYHWGWLGFFLTGFFWVFLSLFSLRMWFFNDSSFAMKEMLGVSK